MSSIKNVLVVGVSNNLPRSIWNQATDHQQSKGAVGPVVVRHLLSAGFTVNLLSRDNSNSTFPNVKVIQTDYSEASLAQACKGQDAIVSTISALGTMTQTKIIDAAIANSVKRFIPSDFGPNTPDLSAIEQNLPALYGRLKPKKAILDYLDEKASANPNFTWTGIGAAPLFDWVCSLDFCYSIDCMETNIKARLSNQVSWAPQFQTTHPPSLTRATSLTSQPLFLR